MNTNDANTRETAKKRLIIFLHFGFVGIGVLTVLLGQILPFLTGKLTISDAQAGYLFAAQFGGSLLGTFFYNRAIVKFGYPKMLFAGFCLMAAGASGLNFDSYFGIAAAITVYGIGIGATIPAINLLIIELNREKSSAAANIINFFWGIGAISSKPFVDFVGSADSVFMPVTLLGIVILLLGAAILMIDYQEIDVPQTVENKTVPAKIWTQPTAWLIAIFGFVHVGIESSVAGWLTTYELRLTETDFRRWISAALVYFLFLLIGRGIAPLFFRRWREKTLMIGSLLLMTVGILLILLAENFLLLTVGAAILGFGTSSVYPMNITRFTRFFGAEATKNATPLFVLGSFGGAFTSWFVGYISTDFQSLRAGFSIVLISCLTLIVLQIALSRKIETGEENQFKP